MKFDINCYKYLPYTRKMGRDPCILTKIVKMVLIMNLNIDFPKKICKPIPILKTGLFIIDS